MPEPLVRSLFPEVLLHLCQKRCRVDFRRLSTIDRTVIVVVLASVRNIQGKKSNSCHCELTDKAIEWKQPVSYSRFGPTALRRREEGMKIKKYHEDSKLKNGS